MNRYILLFLFHSTNAQNISQHYIMYTTTCFDISVSFSLSFTFVPR